VCVLASKFQIFLPWFEKFLIDLLCVSNGMEGIRLDCISLKHILSVDMITHNLSSWL